MEQVGACTAVGFEALANTTGDGFANSAFGYQALLNNTTGNSNTATGADALLNNQTGQSNTAIGVHAMEANIDGSDNTVIGFGALRIFNLGDGNTAIGFGAGTGSAGNNNTMLGAHAGFGIGTASNVICIGANVGGANVDNGCYIGNIFGATSSGGVAVVVNSDGKLGTVVSSRRFKEGLKPMDKASDSGASAGYVPLQKGF